MSTTPSMRNDNLSHTYPSHTYPSHTYPSHTVVGHPPAKTGPNPAIILLNRSSRLLRRDYLLELIEAGFSEIVSVEKADDAYTVESLSIEFRQVRFILIEESFSVGESINLAMTYLQSERAIVLWSTMGVPRGMERALEILRNNPRCACVAPLLRGERNDPLPTMHAPAFHNRTLRILDLPVRGSTGKTIYPFDYVGLYDRTAFQRSGGYDPGISHPYWQRLDFGFRLYLTGGDIPLVPSFRIVYKSLPDPEDRTINRSYARFFARNLAIKLTPQGVRISRAATIRFALRSRMGVPASIRVFRSAATWLALNGRDIKMDPRDLVEQWGVEHD